METNLLYSLKSDVRADENRSSAKSNLTILFLLFVALALAGCEGMESGSSGAASPWPAAPTGSSTLPASQTGVASALNGQWYHDGKPTSIKVAPDGRHLTIIDENGFRTDGVANSPYEFDVRGLKGSVDHGGRRISWSNGGTWTRDNVWTPAARLQPATTPMARLQPAPVSTPMARLQPANPNQGGSPSGAAPGQQDISGRWYHDGKPTSISVSGQTVTITNEGGQSSSGSMSGNQIVISGGLRGHVGPRGQRISWSNGTEWKR